MAGYPQEADVSRLLTCPTAQKPDDRCTTPALNVILRPALVSPLECFFGLLLGRYNPRNGQLTLVCERYTERDENRAHILEQLYALVEEGHRVHPMKQQAAVAHA